MADGLKWLAGVFLGLACSMQATRAVSAYPSPELDRNMMFVPSETLVKATASGYENLIADALWLSLLQYYGDRYFADDRTMVNLEEMFSLITGLDTRFWFAYWLGAWALSDNGQVEAALRLLERGEAANPDEVNYPYLFRLLDQLGYDGWIGCEYRPARGAAAHATSEGLGWMKEWQ
jgi:hypothetical protein